MKILIIGATGTIGKAIVNELNSRHEVIIAGHTRGDIHVDLTNEQSIVEMYKKISSLDAVIVAAGTVHFGPLTSMNNELYGIGLNHKLLGQVNVVLKGIDYLNEAGSFTLTSGVLNHDPIKLGSSASMVNGAIDGFVKSAAIEMPKSIRINCVSPTVLTDSMDKYAPYFRGFKSVSATDVALSYSKSVEGNQTGQIYKVGY